MNPIWVLIIAGVWVLAATGVFALLVAYGQSEKNRSGEGGGV